MPEAPFIIFVIASRYSLRPFLCWDVWHNLWAGVGVMGGFAPQAPQDLSLFSSRVG